MRLRAVSLDHKTWSQEGLGRTIGHVCDNPVHELSPLGVLRAGRVQVRHHLQDSGFRGTMLTEILAKGLKLTRPITHSSSRLMSYSCHVDIPHIICTGLPSLVIYNTIKLPHAAFRRAISCCDAYCQQILLYCPQSISPSRQPCTTYKCTNSNFMGQCIAAVPPFTC